MLLENPFCIVDEYAYQNAALTVSENSDNDTEKCRSHSNYTGLEQGHFGAYLFHELMHYVISLGYLHPIVKNVYPKVSPADKNYHSCSTLKE